MNASSAKASTISGVDAMPVARAPPLQRAPVGDKAVALDVDGGRWSSDAGVVLLKDLDAQRGLPHDLAAVLSDPRDPRRINCTRHDLIQQRVLHIAAGSEDAHDSHTLRDDPLCKRRRERLPETGAPLASQPTLSRCDNRVSRPELSRRALVLLQQCIASSATPPQVIVLEVDDPEDPVHGGQEQARLDGSYGGSCFLPCHGYEGLSGRLITTSLKAKRFTGAQRFSVRTRLRKRLRHAWPKTRVMFRGDSHCASPEVRPWIAAHPDRGSVTGLTSNAVLHQLAQEVIEQAKRASEHRGHKVTRFSSTRSQAGTWSRSRRVVIKVAVAAPGGNTRVVVTALEHARTKGLDQKISGARGAAANDSKDHTRDVKSDRTSWHRFEAHQCRVLLHAAASGLLET